MTALTVNVVGTPAPQGSKRAFVVNGRAVVTEDSKKTKPWRQDVRTATKAAMGEGWEQLTGPVQISLEFFMPRPGYHFGTGRNAGVLKGNAPAYVDKKPDIDKLTRSSLDALTESGVFRDDAQVAELRVTKRYADAATGARITITPLAAVPATGPTPDAGTVQTQAPQEAMF